MKYCDDDIAIAKFIFSKIKELHSGFKPPNLRRWANDVRLTCERDRRTHAEIRELYRWANNDPFWRSNILSPAKLRRQWDRLVIQRDHKPQAGQSEPEKVLYLDE